MTQILSVIELLESEAQPMGVSSERQAPEPGGELRGRPGWMQNSKQIRKLRSSFRRRFLKQLAILLSDFFDEVDDYFFLDCRSGELCGEKAALDARRELLRKQKQFESTFLDSVQGVLKTGEECMATGSVELDSGVPLNAIGDAQSQISDVEIDLALHAAQRRASKYYAEVLNRISAQQKLKSCELIVPASILRSVDIGFEAAQRLVVLPLELRLLFIKLFERHVMLRLDQVFQDLLVILKNLENKSFVEKFHAASSAFHIGKGEGSRGGGIRGEGIRAEGDQGGENRVVSKLGFGGESERESGRGGRREDWRGDRRGNRRGDRRERGEEREEESREVSPAKPQAENELSLQTTKCEATKNSEVEQKISLVVDALHSEINECSKLPDFFREFIDYEWEHAMCRIARQWGIDSSEWQEYRHCIHLITSAAAQELALDDFDLQRCRKYLQQLFIAIDLPLSKQDAFLVQFGEYFGESDACRGTRGQSAKQSDSQNETTISASGAEFLDREDLDEIARLLSDGKKQGDKELNEFLAEVDAIADQLSVDFLVAGNYLRCILSRKQECDDQFHVYSHGAKISVTRSRLGIALALQSGELRMVVQTVEVDEDERTVFLHGTNRSDGAAMRSRESD